MITDPTRGTQAGTALVSQNIPYRLVFITRVELLGGDRLDAVRLGHLVGRVVDGQVDAAQLGHRTTDESAALVLVPGVADEASAVCGQPRGQGGRSPRPPPLPRADGGSRHRRRHVRRPSRRPGRSRNPLRRPAPRDRAADRGPCSRPRRGRGGDPSPPSSRAGPGPDPGTGGQGMQPHRIDEAAGLLRGITVSLRLGRGRGAVSRRVPGRHSSAASPRSEAGAVRTTRSAHSVLPRPAGLTPHRCVS